MTAPQSGSDAPRTNFILRELRGLRSQTLNYPCESALTELSKELERELKTATAQIAKLTQEVCSCRAALEESGYTGALGEGIYDQMKGRIAELEEEITALRYEISRRPSVQELEEWKARASSHVEQYNGGWRGGDVNYGEFEPITDFFPTAKEALEAYDKAKGDERG